ncbi:hypothetical protein [Paenibacillus macquariensis]|uniref:Uncharacterized protein n=1 Tax=Paenibacillus macquariensis TaxID=948756 RepID=A0ABY1K2Z7_9BACL|nr:hypothetical protein [Paenibacillus macquariensis]MEC0090292.1 hypothetical protein [Paenibacillus macquariensis]OAB39652.1 hypothetical protein PMSM_00550 [Paenibacillus macquariensis subsp. macquariensis]SIR18937.1 hypothetical protein SAMN05421578_108120 [Paenibacillus macquariensis]
MQRTIYDFLFQKYDFFQTRDNASLRDQFKGSMKVYWGLKLLAVTIYFSLFLRFVGQDIYLPTETYWFVGSVVAGLLLITLSYLNVFSAWFVITLSKHRKWIDTLLILTGIILCIKLPVYTFGDSSYDISGLRESLFIPGLLLITVGLYRKIHYQKSKVVPFSAIVSVIISACIFIKFPMDSIMQSVYLGFIILLNLGFLVDLFLFYYLHMKLKTTTNYR